jgi:death-on-curing protein
MSSLLGLTKDEVLHIHARVCRDFAGTADPVDTPGVRDVGLLESAVARQGTGAGNYLKYDTVWSNAATLTFGICCNHAFYNGNKRTALVCMIAHLEKNRHALFGTKHDELYAMIKDVAKHSLGHRIDARAKNQALPPRDADREVDAIARWLRKRARRIERDERRITHRQLRQILGQHGFEMRDPKNNAITVDRPVERRRGLRLKRVTEYERICSIAYRGDTHPVALRDIRLVRKLCGLDAGHGYDSYAFYKSADAVDVWINDYRSVLARLSKE